MCSLKLFGIVHFFVHSPNYFGRWMMLQAYKLVVGFGAQMEGPPSRRQFRAQPPYNLSFSLSHLTLILACLESSFETVLRHSLEL